MSEKFDKLLQKWSKEWQEANLTPELRKLISQANFDLWHGPVKNGAYGDPAKGDPEWDSYPGFTTATANISKALSALPSDLYLDTDTDQTSESEPEAEKCESCEGEGNYHSEDGERFDCDDCLGRGSFEPGGDWWHVERPDMIVAIVGKELASYVR